MFNKTVELMSISSNSCSLSDSDDCVLRPDQHRNKKPKRRLKPYRIHTVNVPKRTFDYVRRRLNKKKPIIDAKMLTVEKSHCNRFTLAQINENPMDGVSPESITRLMWEMKICLQNQNYGDLAKLIRMFTEMPMGKARWYSTLLRYCLTVLLYDPLVKGTGLVDLFLEGVVGCRSAEDKKIFLQDINRLPNNIHVTHYDDLWKDYPISNQFNEQTLNQLCETLNKRLDLEPGIDKLNDDIDDEWESYDENDSSADDVTENETTEGENPCNLLDAVNKLQMGFLK